MSGNDLDWFDEKTSETKPNNLISHIYVKTVMNLPPLQDILSKSSEEEPRPFTINMPQHQFSIYFHGPYDDSGTNNIVVNVQFDKDECADYQPAILLSFFDPSSGKLLRRTRHSPCSWNYDQYLTPCQPFVEEEEEEEERQETLEEEKGMVEEEKEEEGKEKEEESNSAEESSSEEEGKEEEKRCCKEQNEYCNYVINRQCFIPLENNIQMVIEYIASPVAGADSGLGCAQFEEYSKKVENHAKTLNPVLEVPKPVSTIESMLANPENTFADFEFFIVRDKTSVKAHKSVLSVRSPVFEAMLRNKMAESTSGRMEISGISVGMFKLFLKHLYLGPQCGFQRNELCLCEVDNLAELMQLADLYGMESLVDQCLKVFKHKLFIGNVARTMKAALMITQGEKTKRLINECSLVLVKLAIEDQNSLNSTAAGSKLLNIATEMENGYNEQKK